MRTLQCCMRLLAVTTPSGAALMREDRDHDATATRDVEDIFRTHYPFVRRVLQYWGVPPSSVDDAVQDVFVVVTRKVDGLDPSTDIRSWLLGVGRRVAGNLRRMERRTKTRRSRIRVLGGESQPSSDYDGDDVELALRLLQRLPDPQRTVFVLADLEGWTAPEIAESVGINTSTVYSRLRTARRRLERMHSELLAREASP